MKTIELIFFGPLVELIGHHKLSVEHPGTISTLKSKMFLQFPALQQVKFTIALNNKMIANDEVIPDQATIAFLPPFSGG